MSKKKIVVIILLICVATVVYKLLLTVNQVSQLKSKGKLAVGHTTSFHALFKSGSEVSYVFWVNNKQYKEINETTSLSRIHFNDFVNRDFPVIYDTGNPSHNRILLTQWDYLLFQVPVPDTLKALIEKTK